nr:MAG TPA: Mind bomb SH3 repeat domain [Bacteriophage sp.]
MAKYKVGDRVRIVSQKPNHPGFMAGMEQYLGKTLTVRSVVEPSTGACYTFDEAYTLPFSSCYWLFLEDWISGLAEPQVKRHDNDLSVVIRFCGNKTTARLMRGETIVKTATARRNPADEYSRAEGARVAMERLFEKKRKEDKVKESKPKIGDKFVVTGKSSPNHHFRIGEMVTLTYPCENGTSLYRNECGREQAVSELDVTPYKGESK